MHGGAIATLIDTAVVPAIGSFYEGLVPMLTISLTINYMGAIIEEDAVCEGWIERRGRSIVFCAAEVTGATSKKIAATASLVYKV
jgi:acyl-coenzyme A thioesterase PaaI-like protein